MSLHEKCTFYSHLGGCSFPFYVAILYLKIKRKLVSNKLRYCTAIQRSQRHGLYNANRQRRLKNISVSSLFFIMADTSQSWGGRGKEMALVSLSSEIRFRSWHDFHYAESSPSQGLSLYLMSVSVSFCLSVFL